MFKLDRFQRTLLVAALCILAFAASLQIVVLAVGLQAGMPAVELLQVMGVLLLEIVAFAGGIFWLQWSVQQSRTRQGISCSPRREQPPGGLVQKDPDTGEDLEIGPCSQRPPGSGLELAAISLHESLRGRPGYIAVSMSTEGGVPTLVLYVLDNNPLWPTMHEGYPVRVRVTSRPQPVEA